jgi:hypothetical protein
MSIYLRLNSDIGGKASTTEVGDAVCMTLKEMLSSSK